MYSSCASNILWSFCVIKDHYPSQVNSGLSLRSLCGYTVWRSPLASGRTMLLRPRTYYPGLFTLPDNEFLEGMNYVLVNFQSLAW